LIQLIYSVPALLDYFLLLSETRLTNLQESLEGMAQQLEAKAEAEDKRREKESTVLKLSVLMTYCRYRA
jgi:hypothetical protein